MSVIADVAQALGVSQRAVRDELNRAAIADSILQVILARSWSSTPEKVAEVAGVTKAELSSAVVRYHDHATREQRATQIAYAAPTGPRQRHVPVGDPPSGEHRWCKRGSHWCHRDDMGRNAARADGYGDWCKACWREYWRTKVDRVRSSKPSKVAVESSKPSKVAPKPRRRSTGPTCVECKAPMRDVDGRPRCVNPSCSIGAKVARRLARR